MDGVVQWSPQPGCLNCSHMFRFEDLHAVPLMWEIWAPPLTRSQARKWSQSCLCLTWKSSQRLFIQSKANINYLHYFHTLFNDNYAQSHSAATLRDSPRAFKSTGKEMIVWYVLILCKLVPSMYDIHWDRLEIGHLICWKNSTWNSGKSMDFESDSAWTLKCVIYRPWVWNLSSTKELPHGRLWRVLIHFLPPISNCDERNNIFQAYTSTILYEITLQAKPTSDSKWKFEVTIVSTLLCW